MVRAVILGAASALALALGGCAGSGNVERWSAAPISTAQYESHPAFDPSNGDLYFVRSTPEFRDWRLMVSACDRRGRRQAPAPVGFAFPGAAEADPSFSEDGQTLYFISDRPVRNTPNAGLDIWRVRRGADGAWGDAEHLPPPVNSEGREWFPRLAPDGWLYFGSSRPGGFGRTDIYRARPDEVGGWRVENLGDHINTAGDEYEADISADGKQMIVSADDDLYVSELRDGRWTPRDKLDAEINSGVMEIGPMQSRDGRAFLFARDTGDPSLSGEIFQYREQPGFPPRCRR